MHDAGESEDTGRLRDARAAVEGGRVNHQSRMRCVRGCVKRGTVQPNERPGESAELGTVWYLLGRQIARRVGARLALMTMNPWGGILLF